MVPLITWLWNHDIDTMGCCQGDALTPAYIQFDAHADLCATLAVLYDHAPAHLRAAIALKPATNGPTWRVHAWTKLWWRGTQNTDCRPDGPDPLYYKLQLPSAHVAELNRTLLNA